MSLGKWTRSCGLIENAMQSYIPTRQRDPPALPDRRAKAAAQQIRTLPTLPDHPQILSPTLLSSLAEYFSSWSTSKKNSSNLNVSTKTTSTMTYPSYLQKEEEKDSWTKPQPPARALGAVTKTSHSI